MTAAEDFLLTQKRRSRHRDEMQLSQGWKCLLCGYYALAMDHSGRPLPFNRGADNQMVPFTCPRCHQCHIQWEPDSLFDDYGDHANLSSVSSAKIPKGHSISFADLMENGTRAARDFFPTWPRVATTAGSGPTPTGLDASTRKRTVDSDSIGVGASQPLNPWADRGGRLPVEVPDQVRPFLEARERSIQAARQKPVRSYACGHCGRRLLRVDAKGELVPLDRTATGNVAPMVCPGCGECHREWVITEGLRTPVALSHNALVPIRDDSTQRAPQPS